MGRLATLDFDTAAIETPVDKLRTVLVVEHGRRLSRVVGYMCDYLGLTMLRVGSQADLAPLLRQHAPSAIVSMFDSQGPDARQVMKLVAAHDRDLPIMLVTGSAPAMIEAADAIAEACGLTRLHKLQDEPGLGDVVEFLINAERCASIAAPHTGAAVFAA